MEDTKIEVEKNLQDMVSKMSDGNPGAINVMMGTILLTMRIDPDSVFGPITALISLDSYHIYGSSIYVLANDQCDGNIHKLLILLRATQMGLFDDIRLQTLAADQSRSDKITDEEWNSMISGLQKDLPNFDVNY